MKSVAKYLVIVAVLVGCLLVSASEANAGWWHRAGYGWGGWGYYPVAYGYSYGCCGSSWVGYRDCCGGGWYSAYRPCCGRAYWGGWGCWGCGGCATCTSCSYDLCCGTPVAPVGGTVSPGPGTTTPTPATGGATGAPTISTPPAPGLGTPPSTPAPGTTMQPAPADSGLLTIYVPADAKVIVNGYETKSVGSRRQYVSYGLKAGYTYKYDIVAQVVRDGKLSEETKSVTVTAGKPQYVQFGLTPKVEAIATTE